MIVPRNRLLLFAGAMVPLVAIAVALSGSGASPGEGGDSSAALIAGMLVALFVLLVLFDALSSRGRLRGVSARLPNLIRLTKDQEGSFHVYVENPELRVSRIRIGFQFPDEITTPDPIMEVDLPSDSADTVLDWVCTPTIRGRYFMEGCYLETSSPMGFWALRSSAEAKTEFRVYPNVHPERKNLAALFLGRGSVGIHSQRQVGKGRDFEKLREYLPGDSFEDIHWKATAKRGKPVTKIFQIERTQEVYVVIDSSRLSARNASLVSERRLSTRPDGHGETSVLERFITAALIMGQAAQRQGDLFGLITFSDRVRNFIRAKNGKVHYDACREALYTLQPRRVAPDFDELFSFLNSRLRRRALLVMLTNVDDPVLAEGFTKNIHVVSRKHLVLVNMIRPPMARPLFSNDQIYREDDVYREMGGHFLWRNLRETEKVLKQRNVSFATVDNETMCTELVSQYLSVKQRQRL